MSLGFDQTLDRREAILERLMELGQGVSGIASTWRNPRPLPTGKFADYPRPMFLLYDSGGKAEQDPLRHKRPGMPPTQFSISPQIVIVLEMRDTVDNTTIDGVVDPVGNEISGWITLINSTITNDAQIIDLVTPNGAFYLSAFETDLKVGRTVGAYGAWLMMLYEFRYPLYPPR